MRRMKIYLWAGVLASLLTLSAVSIDDINGVDWATKVDAVNGVDDASIDKISGVTAAVAPTNLDCYGTTADGRVEYSGSAQITIPM